MPTVARTMRIGEPISKHLSMAWYCHDDVTLGLEVDSIAVVALSFSKLVELCAVAGVVLVQSDVEDVVSRCQGSVTIEELSDDDVVVKAVVHNVEQCNGSRKSIGRKPITLED